jgi:TorA maturation chaperone TorD
MMTTVDWAGLTVQRQGRYRFFGGALLPPSPGLRETLANAAEYLDSLNLETFPFLGEWRAMRVVLEAPAEEDLIREYVRLFASGVDGALCPPTESWYLTEAEGGGIATLVSEVEQAYRGWGFSATSASEPPDHAATELELMSALCSSEARAWQHDDSSGVAEWLRAEDQFLRSHLALWFPHYADRVAAVDAGAFYAAVVRTANAFVLHDVDLVRALRRQVEAPT